MTHLAAIHCQLRIHIATYVKILHEIYYLSFCRARNKGKMLSSCIAINYSYLVL